MGSDFTGGLAQLRELAAAQSTAAHQLTDFAAVSADGQLTYPAST
jgi:hypothetical protein